jgi:nucleoside-diphosphate-sugar epimerase
MEFFRLFKAVKSHILPIFGGGKQPLSLVYVKDLASIAVETLFNSKAIGKIYFVANPEFTTALGLANAIKEAMNVWTVPLCLPVQGAYQYVYVRR